MNKENKYSRKFWNIPSVKEDKPSFGINYFPKRKPTALETEYSDLYYNLIYKGRTLFDQMAKDYNMFTKKKEQIGDWETFRIYNPTFKDSTDAQLQEILESYNVNEIHKLIENPPQEIINFYNEHFVCYFDYEFTNIFGNPVKIESQYCSDLEITKEQLIECIVDPEINNVQENQKEAYYQHIYEQYVGMVNEIWD